MDVVDVVDVVDAVDVVDVVDVVVVVDVVLILQEVISSLRQTHPPSHPKGLTPACSDCWTRRVGRQPQPIRMNSWFT